MKRVSLFAGDSSSGISTRFWAKSPIPALLLALACMFAGCDSDDGADGASSEAGSGGTGANDASAGAQADTDAASDPGDDGVILSWKVRAVGESFSDWFEWPALEGVEVCLIESINIPCVATDEEGVFVLPAVPKNSELLLTFAKEGYVPQLVSARTGTANIEAPEATQPFMMQKNRNDEELDALFDALGVVVDEDKGGINVVAVDASLSGNAARLSLSIHPQKGDGPFFWDTNMHIVPNATRLSREMPVATFHNLDEGEYVISWDLEEPENISCGILGVRMDPPQSDVMYGLPAAQPDAMRVKVRPGFASGLNVIVCTPIADPDADAGA